MEEKNEKALLKKTARRTGLLFITATVMTMMDASLTWPILQNKDFLGLLPASENKIVVGALLSFISAIASAGIAISMYPVLKKHNQALAVGAVGFRLVEAVFYIIGTLCLVMLLPLSKEFIKSGADTGMYFNTLANLLLDTKNLAGFVFGASAFSIGAMMYYWVLYKSKLVPRWLSVWGLIGIVLMLVTSLSTLFAGEPFTISGNMLILISPIFFQEMVLAVWLIAKGFNAEETAVHAAIKERIPLLS